MRLTLKKHDQLNGDEEESRGRHDAKKDEAGAMGLYAEKTIIMC